MTKIYLCGPMTGIPQFNVPLFDRVATELRAVGFDVVSPAELDNPETRRLALLSKDGAPGTGSANGETWGDFLARDVKLLADGGIDGIVFIRWDWYKSRGARLEATVGLLCGLKFAQFDPSALGLLKPMSYDEVESGIRAGFKDAWIGGRT